MVGEGGGGEVVESLVEGMGEAMGGVVEAVVADVAGVVAEVVAGVEVATDGYKAETTGDGTKWGHPLHQGQLNTGMAAENVDTQRGPGGLSMTEIVSFLNSNL